MKWISTRLHGVLDYAAVALLLIVPRVLGFAENVVTLTTFMAVSTLLYSLFTRYELAAKRILPMPVHLVLDFLSGFVLIGAAMWLPPGSQGIASLGALMAFLIGFGFFEIAASLMSQTHAPVENKPQSKVFGSGTPLRL